MSTTAPRKKAGSTGGAAATGDKKRRSMHGVKVGRGSAGRVNSTVGIARYRDPNAAPMSASGVYFPDVVEACNRWLKEHGQSTDFSFRELIDAEAREGQARKAMA